jgi:hypothetical protein
MADLSTGEVDIILDGKETTLRCSLDAAKRVSAIANGSGYMGVQARLGAMDHETYVLVIAAGLDKKPADVETAVFRTGLVELTKLLVLYVANLANGGKPLTEG